MNEQKLVNERKELVTALKTILDVLDRPELKTPRKICLVWDIAGAALYKQEQYLRERTGKAGKPGKPIIKKRLDTRDRLVKDLTPSEAGSLLVHCHSITPERRRALLLLWSGGNAKAHFTDEEIESIKTWIANEQHLPQDSKLADHPKRATAFCPYCGDVETCQHLTVVSTL